ncbi:hypothetical protein [uncultured Microscilla sp.]|uniref:hypothetical protein n=1 Tax=uncultured Microscilla sp. TaxID=432653 RepID=UPI00262A9382|nr:hypothetical protein [uncultured Microscilla sp.]
MKAITENGRTITIDDKYEIRRGGEGKILTIPERPDQVAKIYLDPNVTHLGQAQKDALSVLDSTYFVRPIDLIYQKKGKKINTQKGAIGFTMEYLPPDFVPLAALFKKNYCTSNQIDAGFKNNLIKQLPSIVSHAHSQDIVIGDLSGYNIMVNPQGTLKFIDVDAYETPIHTHSGVLFDEIRDYLYKGIVSKNSDYFALSIVVFNLLTYMHPFKGVHKLYKAMAERMVRKIPVFANDANLIIPKCYLPVKDVTLQQQFELLYAEGERFMLTIGQPVAPSVTTPVVAPATVTAGNLTVKEVYQPKLDEYIIRVVFQQNQGLIITNYQTLVYDASNQGYVTLKQSITSAQLPAYLPQEELEWFAGEKNILVLHQGKLYHLLNGGGFQLISNFSLSAKARYKLIDNILVVLDGEHKRWVHLDDITKDFIRIEQTPVFVPGFDVFNGLIQNTGGVQYVFYHSGHSISTVKSALPLIASVHIQGNVGWVSYDEQVAGEVTRKYEYFSIDGLQMKMSGELLPGQRLFAYKTTSPQAGIVFEPNDDQMLVRRSQDFKVLQEFDCSILTTESSLVSTQAGIIAYEKDFCYLLNSK